MVAPLSVEAVAASAYAAFKVADLDGFGELLAPDVRWGGADETDDTCHGRAEVLTRYRRLAQAGVRADLGELTVRGNAITLEMRLDWPDGPPRGLWQVFRVGDGQIREIRGYPSYRDAARYAATIADVA